MFDCLLLYSQYMEQRLVFTIVYSRYLENLYSMNEQQLSFISSFFHYQISQRKFVFPPNNNIYQTDGWVDQQLETLVRKYLNCIYSQFLDLDSPYRPRALPPELAGKQHNSHSPRSRTEKSPWEDGGEIGGSRVHFPSTPVKYLADLRSRSNSQQYSSIYEDRRPKIEDIERSDGETRKPGVLKRPE